MQNKWDQFSARCYSAISGRAAAEAKRKIIFKHLIDIRLFFVKVRRTTTIERNFSSIFCGINHIAILTIALLLFFLFPFHFRSIRQTFFCRISRLRLSLRSMTGTRPDVCWQMELRCRTIRHSSPVLRQSDVIEWNTTDRRWDTRAKYEVFRDVKVIKFPCRAKKMKELENEKLLSFVCCLGKN